MLSYHSLAPLNSVLNAVAAILLLAGFYCIRRKWVRAHRAFMLSAFTVSAAFFTSYSVYHYHVGDVRFQGLGWVRPIYFTILISHVFLAAAIVPLVLVTLWRALKGNFRRHRRIAVWAWPMWIYVSITGVVVYLMCYQFYPPGYSKPIGPPALTAAVEHDIRASRLTVSARRSTRLQRHRYEHSER
jgi:putative membrane protein